MSRLLRALGASWRASLLTATQYRGDFLLTASMSALFSVWTALPLFFVYQHTEQVAGFGPWEALLVMAFFLLLRGLLDAFIEPNLRGLVERIRQGTLDFTLLKPVDAQVLVSFARFEPARLADVAIAIGLSAFCLSKLGHVPSVLDILGAVLCVLSGAAILYSLWLLAAASAFFWVRVDSLSYLLGALLDAGRWPATVYRGWMRVLLTVVLPVTVMTTFPAQALLRRLEPMSALGGVGLAAAFLVVSRLVWRKAVGHYTSASS